MDDANKPLVDITKHADGDQLSFNGVSDRGIRWMESRYGQGSKAFDIMTEMEAAEDFAKKAKSAGLMIG